MVTHQKRRQRSENHRDSGWPLFFPSRIDREPVFVDGFAGAGQSELNCGGMIWRRTIVGMRGQQEKQQTVLTPNRRMRQQSGSKENKQFSLTKLNMTL